MRRPLTIVLACLTVVAGIAPAAGHAQEIEAPVLHRETERGTMQVVVEGEAPAPGPKVVDGEIDDWQGAASGFGGTVVRSAGELVYQDHLFDAYGPDDGRDAEREQVFGPARETAPETYRLEALFQADLPGQVGLDSPEQLEAEEHYGDLDHVDAADLLEVRVAVHGGRVHVLGRTTTMRDTDTTALLVLADTGGDPVERDVPFGSGLTTSAADVAVLLAPEGARLIDLDTGKSNTSPSVVRNPSGYVNAIEGAVPRHFLERPDGTLRLAVAAGVVDPGSGDLAPLPGDDGGPRVANVAFRTDEPVRVWFERDQALALHAGSIDDSFVDVDPTRLAEREERLVPGPGYHDRIFTSTTEGISTERDEDGIHQHYGVWIPDAAASGDLVPVTTWLHWRGGKAHSAAALTPKVFRDQGEARGGIVLAPRGRGTSTWYVGEGHADVLEVWEDAYASFPIDPDRAYLSGHSMGGWGSYLFAILYPDRFAGTFPVAGPVTQGAWTGMDFEGCDDFRYEEYTPCYVDTNDGDARTQHTRPLLDNLRHVPVSIFQGGADELVPTSGVTRQVERLVELGYRHRYYLFPTYEHYSHPVVDEWMEGVRYLDAFTRDPDPARVTYVRDMPFERTVETGPDQRDAAPDLDLSFDSAYWMSGLTPVDLLGGRARVDARSFAIGSAEPVLVPEAGGPAAPGQTGPYVMSGLAWLDDPLATPEVRNAFEATLTGASGVRFDLARMSVSSEQTVEGTISTEAALVLELVGDWTAAPTVTVDGDPVAATYGAGVLTIPVPAGDHAVTITP